MMYVGRVSYSASILAQNQFYVKTPDDLKCFQNNLRILVFHLCLRQLLGNQSSTCVYIWHTRVCVWTRTIHLKSPRTQVLWDFFLLKIKKLKNK